MTDRTPIGDEFEQRLTAIVRELDRVFDLADVEDSMLELLRFVERHPDHTPEFQSIFRSFIDKDLRAVVEPLEFTMRTLRWPETRAVLEDIRDNSPDTASGFDRSHWARRVLNAYDPSWENQILYSHYRRPS